MVEELRLAFERAQQQPDDVQRQIAELVRHVLDGAQPDAGLPVEERETFAGAWSDLPEDDEVEALDRMRHAVAPTPPQDEEQRWLDEP